MNIGQQLKHARKTRGMTQKHLGELLGYTESQICYFEKGKRRIPEHKMVTIENILEMRFGKKNVLIESKADKIFEIIKYLFATPDNIDQINEIWER